MIQVYWTSVPVDEKEIGYNPTNGHSLPKVILRLGKRNRVILQESDILEFEATELTWSKACELMLSLPHKFSEIFEEFEFLKG